MRAQWDMPAPDRNRLLDALPERDRGALLAVGREVDLQDGQRLNERGHRISCVYFPLSAYLSLHVVAPSDGPEVMMVGSEGAVGAQLALGPASCPLSATVQAAGTAWSFSAEDFTRQLHHSVALHALLLAYVDTMLQQIAISCGCMHAHVLDARLARRLLMTHDCAGRTDFHVTHEFLASVLGVRRVGITNAATNLQRLGLIRYQRGAVSVLDRKGLESASCSCYAASRRIQARAATRRRPLAERP